MRRAKRLNAKRPNRKSRSVALAPLWRRLLWPGVFALIAFAILCSLGMWQIERLTWKQDLIARVENRTHAAARPLPPEQDWPRVSAERDEYHHVRLSGKFQYDHEVFAYALLSNPRGKFSGPGYWVMTPLKLDSGALVLVNRGFVPMDRMDLPTRTAGQEDAPVTVTGLLRLPEGRNWFTPPDDVARRIWQERDPAAIARAEGLARVAPFFVDADGSGPNGLPQGGETRVSFPNNHLQYVVTWFGLAFALLAVFAAFAHKEWRRERA
jgi:surfeit locus 1 family protein